MTDMNYAFVNGWKRYQIPHDGTWARSIRLIELSVLHAHQRYYIRAALFGFSLEVVIP